MHNYFRLDRDCAQKCLDFGDKCVSFEYEYQTDDCLLQAVIEGPGVHLRLDEAYRNFERLSSGHSAWFYYDNMPLIHGEVYYINVKITNNMGKVTYFTIIVRGGPLNKSCMPVCLSIRPGAISRKQFVRFLFIYISIKYGLVPIF